ncbi:MAG: trypsin-like peptidase domain-containing protein [Candidatus Bathyarchaeia archaeon]
MSEPVQHPAKPKTSKTLLALVFIAGLLLGVLPANYLLYQQIEILKNKVSTLEGQVSKLWGFQNVTNQTIIVYQNSSSLSELYERVKDSVVLILGTLANTSLIQGSGFVYNFSGTMVVITNNHVVHRTTSISVTFSNGNGYEAKINGTDPYADLAILVVNAPNEEFKPIDIVSSSTLRVGDPVIAIGNPYGLVGSLTTGVVSALGRTITGEEYTGGFAIANIIQTSAPINPGNSGGPLLNYDGKVVGITTAIVADSQGLGFAVPSNTILREIHSLVTTGGYDNHSYLGLRGTDMDYLRAKEIGVNVTYGWYVAEVVFGGPSYNAGIQKDDVLIGINGTRIRNGDEMSSYLEEKTLPNENVTLTVVRGSQTLNVPLTLGRRPPP